MRVLLTAIGSEGDVQPFLALGQRLIASGHEVRLATSDRYRPRAAALGVPFVPIGPPWDEDFTKTVFAKLLAERQPLRQLGIVLDGFQEYQLATVPELVKLAGEVDVVVYPQIFVAAVAAARAAHTKHVSVHFAPLHRAQNYSPLGSNMGRFGNAAMWWMTSAMLRRTADAKLNSIVEAAGLAPWRDVLLDASHSKLLDLVAVSPRVLPKDPLWGEQTRVTGYWFAEEPKTAPDSALEAFLRDEPPVVIGFGSMMGLDAARATARIADAVKDLGRRVVVQAGWAALGQGELPPNVYVTGFVPHAWLLERAACVVHHGGAGTTAAAFRAGLPQAIVWHLGDQPEWGRRVAKLGVGPTMCSHHDVDARWLRSAIDRMLSDADMKARAKALGAAIRSEDGVGVAVRAIEALAPARS